MTLQDTRGIPKGLCLSDLSQAVQEGHRTNWKFLLFMIRSQGEQNIMATYMTSTRGLATHQKQVEKFVEEYNDIFTLANGVPLHCEVKHSINLIHGMPLPNGLVYMHSLLENEEIKCQIQDLLQKGHIQPNSSPCENPIVLVQKKDGTW